MANEKDQLEDVNADEILKSVELNFEEGTSEDDVIEDDIIEESESAEIIKPPQTYIKTDGDDKETKKLYAEFSEFIEDKVEMKEDSGSKLVIPTGIDILDAILGGGLAVGALSIVVGSPGSGKSMLAIQTLGQAQKQHSGDLIGAYLDSEEATTAIRLSNLGVRFPKIRPYPDITIEKVFKFLEGLCLFKESKKITHIPSVVVWDSIANTLSEKEREAVDVNSVIGYKARMLSILIPKYVARCAQYNIALIGVNQLRDVLSIGPYSAPRDLKFMTTSKTMPGGNILRYNAFHLIEMNIKSILKPEMYGFDGVIDKVKCVKNKLFPPNIEVEIVGSFTTGFSNFWTNFNFLKETKRLKAGAWNSLVSMPDKKFRTKDAENTYNTDSDFKSKFDEAVKETIQNEIIEKHNPVID